VRREDGRRQEPDDQGEEDGDHQVDQDKGEPRSQGATNQATESGTGQVEPPAGAHDQQPEDEEAAEGGQREREEEADGEEAEQEEEGPQAPAAEEVSDGESQEGDFQEEDPGQLQRFTSQCVLAFELENTGHVSQTVELSIEPELDEAGAPMPCNFRVPRSLITCQVSGQSRKSVIRLTKLDPEAEGWGPFQWHFRLKEKNANP